MEGEELRDVGEWFTHHPGPRPVDIRIGGDEQSGADGIEERPRMGAQATPMRPGEAADAQTNGKGAHELPWVQSFADERHRGDDQQQGSEAAGDRVNMSEVAMGIRA